MSLLPLVSHKKAISLTTVFDVEASIGKGWNVYVHTSLLKVFPLLRESGAFAVVLLYAIIIVAPFNRLRLFKTRMRRCS